MVSGRAVCGLFFLGGGESPHLACGASGWLFAGVLKKATSLYSGHLRAKNGDLVASADVFAPKNGALVASADVFAPKYGALAASADVLAPKNGALAASADVFAPKYGALAASALVFAPKNGGLAASAAFSEDARRAIGLLTSFFGAKNTSG